MEGETKKISFGFSKVSKKNNIIQPKKEVQNDIQFIECLEEKSIKLVSGEEKKKELPIIPMRIGNSLRENIKEVVKSRERSKNNVEYANNSLEEKIDEAPKEPLSLDELATKEILEDLKKPAEGKKTENDLLAVPMNNQDLKESVPSTLEDYDRMPISDFGLAMLRGMGWAPNKGIGLNEKIVTPLAPTLRPKGMGLGADKVPIQKNVTADGELLVMKKGAPVKIISGPHINFYGKIEGFDELPGRLMVRISSTNVVVSLNEIMVQLVSQSEFNRNVEQKENSELKSEKSRLGSDKSFEIINSRIKNESKESNKVEARIVKKEKTRCVKVDNGSVLSDSDESEKFSEHRNIEARRRRSISSDESVPISKHRNSRERKSYGSRNKETYTKSSRDHKSRYNSSSPERSRRKKKSRRRGKYETSSTDSDDNNYEIRNKKTKKSKRSASTDSLSSSGNSRRKVYHSRKHTKYYYK